MVFVFVLQWMFPLLCFFHVFIYYYYYFFFIYLFFVCSLFLFQLFFFFFFNSLFHMSHSKHNSRLGTWHREAFRVHIKTFLQCECKGGFFVVRGAQRIFYLTIFQLYDLHKILYYSQYFSLQFRHWFFWKWCTSVFPYSIFIQANNIIWHVLQARHFYNVKLVKIIYTNLLKASLNKPSSLCQVCTVKQDMVYTIFCLLTQVAWTIASYKQQTMQH